MALDANILLQRTTPNLMQALQSGIQAGQAMRQAPLLEALQKQRLASMKAQTGGIKEKWIGTPSRTTHDGKEFLTGVVQTAGGGFERRSIPIEGEFVSQLGETAADQTQRAIAQAGGQRKAVLEQDLAFKPDIEAAVGAAKSKQDLKFKPQIMTAVKLAEKEATAKGETLTDLNRLKAGMPGLTGVVEELKELAPIATSTLGGRAFDFAVKESGFGATKGSTARAKFIAIIDNQVLPLLKATFGGSFSIQEGESLKASMGNPNSTVEEKLAQLDAFIAQKARDIESKEAEVGAPQQEFSGQSSSQQPAQTFNFDAQGNLIQ